MENAKKTINLFMKNKYSPNELKAELYKAGVAAMEEGWTFMDASFQLGGKARDDGMDGEEVEQTLRRAFSAQKRSSERPEEKPAPAAQNAAPSAEGFPAQPQTTAPPQTVAMPIINPLSAGMISMEQMLAMGLDTQSLELLQNFKIDPEAPFPGPPQTGARTLPNFWKLPSTPTRQSPLRYRTLPKAARNSSRTSSGRTTPSRKS